MVIRDISAGPRSPPLQPVVPLSKKQKRQGLSKVSAALRKLSGIPVVPATSSRKPAAGLQARTRPQTVIGHELGPAQRMKRSNSVGSRRDSFMEPHAAAVAAPQPRRQNQVRVLRRHHSTYVERRPLGSSPPLPPLPALPGTGDSPDSVGYLPKYTAAPSLDMPDFQGLGIAIEQDLIVAEPKSNQSSRRGSAAANRAGLVGSKTPPGTYGAMPVFSPVDIRPLSVVKRSAPYTHSQARPVSTATLEINLPQLDNAALPVVESSPARISDSQLAQMRMRKATRQHETAKRHTVVGGSSMASPRRTVEARETPIDMSKYCLRPTVSVACQTPTVWPQTQLPVRASTPPQAYSSFSAVLLGLENTLPPPPPPASTKYMTNIANSPSIYSFVSPVQRPTAGFVRQNSTLETPQEEVAQPQLEFTPTAASYARMPSSPSPPMDYVPQFRRQSIAGPFHPASSSAVRRGSMFVTESKAPLRPATVVNPSYYAQRDGANVYDAPGLLESQARSPLPATNFYELVSETRKQKSASASASFDGFNPFTAAPCVPLTGGLEEDIAPEDLVPTPTVLDDSSSSEEEDEAHSPILSTVRRVSLVSTPMRASVRRASVVRVSPTPSRRGSASCSPRSSISSVSIKSFRDDVLPAVPPIPRKFSVPSISGDNSPCPTLLDQRRASEPLSCTTRKSSASSSSPLSGTTDLTTPRLRTTPLSTTTADRLSKSRSFFLVQALENQQRRASLAFEAKQIAKMARATAAVQDGVEPSSESESEQEEDDESVLSDETASVVSHSVVSHNRGLVVAC
ncbi:hypothetical protein OIV83_000903 [Microbotryomycetes sp. JL201]|nr:hypothetical protein OIV83_000903 [Microbotryomycetes sp. JL201]